jgi:Ca2+-dependent lipid-binding protein
MLFLFIYLLIIIQYSQSSVVNYVEYTYNVLNPERGFHEFSDLTADSYTNVRKNNHTLVYGQILANAFTSSNFSVYLLFLIILLCIFVFINIYFIGSFS